MGYLSHVLIKVYSNETIVIYLAFINFMQQQIYNIYFIHHNKDILKVHEMIIYLLTTGF